MILKSDLTKLDNIPWKSAKGEDSSKGEERNPNIPAVMTPMELCAILKIGRNNIYALLRSGQIRSVRIGRKIRISREAVLEFLNGIN